MEVPFAYTPTLESGIDGLPLALSAEESFHLVRVLRLRAGAPLVLTDGQGRLARGEILTASAVSAIVRVDEVRLTDRRRYRVHVAIAPPRHPGRLEWFLEKATETGIDVITLLICERSDKWKVKTGRLQRLLVAAMKQSRQAWLPELNGPVGFSGWLPAVKEEGKWIGWCPGDQPNLAKVAGKHPAEVVAIGPEGDFTPAEVEEARNFGFVPITLGPNRLRTETAGLLACHTLHLVREREVMK